MNSFTQIEGRLRKLVLLFAALGTLAAAYLQGPKFAGAFVVGTIGAWLNLLAIVGVANKLSGPAAKPATEGPGTPIPSTPGGARLSARFLGLVLGAFVILYFSGFNARAALWGFFVFPAAVFLEILYELATFNNSK
jgi:hypothetical protein